MTQHTKVAFIIEVGGAVSRAQDAEKQTKSTKATADAKRRRRNPDFFLRGYSYKLSHAERLYTKMVWNSFLEAALLMHMQHSHEG